jgi:polysaccharide export outer membrane protein
LPCGSDLGIPRELCKSTLPGYAIEPPDILLIEAVNIVPRSPYRLRTLDVLSIQVQDALPEAPIEGPYAVQLGGFVNLGVPYGSVKVAGMTVDEAKEAIDTRLRETLREPIVTVTLGEIGAKQQIAGEHLVTPDGTVNLGTYGTVRVVGLTIEEAKAEIESHLSEYLEDPEVAVSVFAYNSKVYYVVTQGAGLGDRVYRFPVTGNETVLDAISQINGLESVSSTDMWIARPTPDPERVQLLPVNWNKITAHASVDTNYQIFPGDRIFIAEDRWVALDSTLAKWIAPVERVMGFSILGAATVTRFSGNVLRGGGNPTGGRGGVGGF